MTNPFATSRTATPPAEQAQPDPAPQTQTQPQFANAGDAMPEGDPFASPTGPGSDEKITDFDGHLMLVTPTEHVENMSTAHGETDVIRADVVILDGDRPGYQVPDLLVFQTALKRDLIRVLGGPSKIMLGRLGRGQAKAGKSAPWIFTAGTDEDKKLAMQYMEAQPKVG